MLQPLISSTVWLTSLALGIPLLLSSPVMAITNLTVTPSNETLALDRAHQLHLAWSYVRQGASSMRDFKSTRVYPLTVAAGMDQPQAMIQVSRDSPLNLCRCCVRPLTSTR